MNQEGRFQLSSPTKVVRHLGQYLVAIAHTCEGRPCAMVRKVARLGLIVGKIDGGRSSVRSGKVIVALVVIDLF